VKQEAPYEAVVIGAGQAGVPLAHALARAGWRVALAERADLGGSCVNFGCTPSKAVIASARAAFQARRGAVFGLRVPTVEVDFPAVLDRARSILMQSRASLRRGFEKTDNPRLLAGHARLEGRAGGHFRVRVADRLLKARRVVLDTGTRADFPPIAGLSALDVLHSENWLDNHELPRHVLFAGGGTIGLEMGQFYRRMGSRVTIVDPGEQVLKREEREVAHLLQRLLESEGIEFRLRSRVIAAARRRAGFVVTIEAEAGGREEFRVTHLFVSAGRRPNTDDLGLETVGVRPGQDGFLQVDDRLATGSPGLWAAGDIRGGPMFTHTSWDDFRILESQLLGDGSRTTRRVVPYAVYTDPELGRVGETEEEAREGGRAIRVGRFAMRDNSKARELSETEGFIKVVVDASDGRIRGASLLGADASELVHVYVDLMNAGASYTVLRDAIHVHPTLAEAVQSAVASLE